MTNSAGSKRRARRNQNAARSTAPDLPRSSSSSDVIRNPETTKNTSTPIHPPRIHENPAWYRITAITDNARSPSRPGW